MFSKILRYSPLQSKQLVDWIIHWGCRGLAPWDSAATLAGRYTHIEDRAEAAKALISQQARQSFTTSCIGGLGAWPVPVSIPFTMALSLVLQARLAAALAHLHGHDLNAPQTRTGILLCLEAAYVGPQRLAQLGQPQNNLNQWLIELSPLALKHLNEKIGQRLLTRAATGRWRLVSKALPIAGAVLAGGLDAYSCRRVGRHANKLFAT